MSIVEPVLVLALCSFLLGIVVLGLAIVTAEIRRRDVGTRHTRARHAMGKPGRRR